MSTFALSTTDNYADVISGLNYALANLGSSITAIQYNGNIMVANTQTGVISSISASGTTDVPVISYLYGYVAIAYANSSTGASGFTSNSRLANYYGVQNINTPIASTNPVDYSWFQVSGGFGTNKSLFYTTSGGNQISFFAGNAAPNIYYQSVIDSTPILLATLANSIVVANSISTGAVTTSKVAQSAITQTINVADNTSYPLINFVNGTTNNPTTPGYLWPWWTRGFAIGGGATIKTTTNGAVNGSSIVVNYNAYINSATNAEYNLVELWKSGGSNYYKNTFEIVRTYTPSTNGGINGNIDQFFIPGDNGAVYLGNIGSTGGTSNVRPLLTNTTNNLYDGQMGIDAQSAWWFGQSGTYGSGTFTNSYTSNVANVVSYYGSVGSAYPLFNIYGSSILEWTVTPGVGGGVSSPTIIVGSGGVVAFWTGQETNYQNGLWAFESSGVFADLFDICTDIPTGYWIDTTGRTYNNVIVGSGGVILYNARTLNSTANIATSSGWSQASSGTIQNLRGIQSNYTYPSYNTFTRGNLWVAVGDQGTVLRSSSGAGPWTPANVVPTTNNLNAVGYTNGYWVAVGDAGTIITSTDGDTWVGPIANPADGNTPGIGVRNLYGVAGGQRQFNWVVAGQEIIMMANTTNPNGGWTSNIYLGGASVSSQLTRLQYQGSWSNVANVSQPPAGQRVTNGQVVSGTYTDTDYVSGQTLSYYLVVGNMYGNVAITTNGPNMTVTEFKR